MCWNRWWLTGAFSTHVRGKRVLAITPGADLERDTTRANGSMQDLLTFLAAHVDEWDSSTEDEARRDFQ
ncbi:hypothetical protein RI054_26g110010 [Pseudoscourfieldia marina]